VLAVDARNRRAAAPRLALVARHRGVVEIEAACPLQQIAAGRRHVAQLLRGAREDRARQQRIAAFHDRVIGKVGIRHQRADLQTAGRRFLHRLERQVSDVDQPRRPLDLLLHQVDQIGAAGDEFRLRVGGGAAHRVGDVACTRVCEIDHDRLSMTSRIAATMFG
jgi:hypothetical protein